MNSNEIYVSLDVGTSNIKIIIGEMTGEALNIIGVGIEKSEGIKKGSIVDIDETVHSIQGAVQKAERMVGLKIKSVIVGITGNHVELMPCHGIVAVSSENREIDHEDIVRVMDAAQVIPLAPEREIIDVIPRQFIVDGLEEIIDPRGMVGVRLEMEGTIITGSKTILHNLLRCVEKAGLEVADICLQPLASAAIALSKDEKNLGVALVDIGGGSTTLSVFEEGTLQVTSILPIGGNYITKDISIGMRTSTENAEKVKIAHGHAFIDRASSDETFMVPKIGGQTDQEFNQVDLASIIEPRLEELFQWVEKELHHAGYKDLPGGYVLTGGVASLQGIHELAEDIFHHNVRIAIPDYIGVREPQYTTAVGLIQFTYRNVKIQGKEVAATVSSEGAQDHYRKKRQASKKKGANHMGMGKRVKDLFGLFFE